MQDDIAKAWRRVRCCNGKSYCHYCVVCCSPLGAPDGVAVPKVRLPMHVSILLKDGQQRSTSLHAKVIAPDDVDVYGCFHGSTDEVPEFDPARTVVALPSEGAVTWAELDGLEAVDHLVLLCSPWQQVHKLAELPQVSRLRHVRIGGACISSGFWRVPPRDAGPGGSHLATIEALVHLLREYPERTHALAAPASEAGAPNRAGRAQGSGRDQGGAGAVERVESHDVEDLLFFFHVIRGTIKERGAIGRCGPSGPFEREGRDAFRACKAQKARESTPRDSLRARFQRAPAQAAETPPVEGALTDAAGAAGGLGPEES